MHTPLSARMAHELLCMVEQLDRSLTHYRDRELVSASEVTDLLLDLRSIWLRIVLAEACDHHE